MSMVVFMTIIFQFSIWFFQLVYYLERKEEKNRYYFFVLVTSVLAYNIVGGLFPDKNYPISVFFQNIIDYAVGLVMMLAFLNYFRKGLNIEGIENIVVKGVPPFLIIPFLTLFTVVYGITENLQLGYQVGAILPVLFSLFFIGYASRVSIKRYKSIAGENFSEKREMIFQMVTAYLALIGCASLPVVKFLTDSQALEHSLVNIGFLIMTLNYVRVSIYTSRQEYDRLKRSEEELSKLNSNLQQEVDARSEEVRRTYITLAHETKTPLTLINNYLNQYITKYGNTDELKVVQYNLERLTKDIINFFDNERFILGLNVYNHTEVLQLHEMMKHKLPLFVELAATKKIRIISDIEGKGYLKANPAAIERVINNLLDNAVKFTPEGGTIHVSLTENARVFTFTVEDNGIGIPVGVQNKIFEKYFQMKSFSSNPGMGIGLDLVKNIVDSLGGTISLDSTVEIGSKFIIKLPKYEPQKHDEIFSQYDRLKKITLPGYINEVYDIVQEDDRPNIMLVDDNIPILHFIAESFKEFYNIYVATSGEIALGKIEVIDRLDLIISDVMMGGMNGFEFREKLLKTSRHNTAPFIFLTAKANDQHKLTGLGMGAIGYVEKPFIIEHLKAKVDSVLSLLIKKKKQVIADVFQGKSSQIQEWSKPISEMNMSNIRQKFDLDEVEMKICEMMIENILDEDIAQQLNLSRQIFNQKVLLIFSKLDVNNKIEAIRKFSIGR